jgi:hypothetical protein
MITDSPAMNPSHATTSQPMPPDALYLFRRALAKSDLTSCRELLANWPNLSALGDTGNDLIMAALDKGFIEGLRLMVEHGVRVRREAPTQLMPLANAAQLGQLDACKILVEAGVDVNEVDANGDTALHRAMSLSSREPVKVTAYLLSSGAKHSPVNDREMIPLHRAAFSGHYNALPLARMLVAAGASPAFTPDAAKADYLTPFQLFFATSSAEPFHFFVEHCNEDPNQRTLDGRALEEVAFVQDDDLEKALLAARSYWAVRDGIAGTTGHDESTPALSVASTKRTSSFDPI